MLTLLIDGDTIVYKFATGMQKSFDWGSGVTSSSADLEAAQQFTDKYILDLVEELDADRVVVALSDPHVNWRLDILPSYKQNRADYVRPILWAELREHIRDNYDTYQRPTLEGDDVCGILATHPLLIKGEKVIVGIDKDLRTLPGRHYNPETKEHFAVNEAQADWYHMYQTLVGDRVDNYKGCPYVGPIKAQKILGQIWEALHIDMLWPVVVLAYERKGLTEVDALEQAQVARICRHTDYDFSSKRVIPWLPNTQ